jgi:acyl carrier protein
MAGLWEEMLGIDRVGIQDSFFELGGNSLLGISLISRVREELGAELARHVLYEAPTVAALVARIEGEGESEEAYDEWRDRGARRRLRERQPRREPAAERIGR